MRIFILVAIILLSCKDHKYIETRTYSKEDEIDSAIYHKARSSKDCHEDYSYVKNDRGHIDTSIRTFLCDTLGNVFIIRVVNKYDIKETYLTYFLNGNIVKIASEYFQENPYRFTRSEYFIDHDTIFLKKEGERIFDRVDHWIVLNKMYYKQYDSLKRNQ